MCDAHVFLHPPLAPGDYPERVFVGVHEVGYRWCLRYTGATKAKAFRGATTPARDTDGLLPVRYYDADSAARLVFHIVLSSDVYWKRFIIVSFFFC